MKSKRNFRNPKLGITALFTATIFYGFYGILSRLIGSAFGNFNQGWIRNLIVLGLIWAVILVSKTKLKKLNRKDIKWLLLWFTSGSWVAVLTFIAFNNLPISTTYLVLYAAMILSGFISGAIFFKEKTRTPKTISLVFALLGLIIIYRFTVSADKTVYLFLIIVSGFMTGIWNTISKKFSDNYSNNQLVFMDALSSVVAALVGSIIFKDLLPKEIAVISWVWISLYAVAQTLNVGLIVYGFKNVEAQIGSLILPVEIIFATVFSYLIFSEVPSLFTVIGGLFIIAAAVLPSLIIVKNNDKS
jgi:drug/metabolite transporter (DMT)-like permease